MSLAAGLAVCAAVAGYVGYSCQNAVERKEKELEFLHLSRPAAVRDVYDQLQARKDKGLDPSGVFEVAVSCTVSLLFFGLINAPNSVLLVAGVC